MTLDWVDISRQFVISALPKINQPVSSQIKSTVPALNGHKIWLLNKNPCSKQKRSNAVVKGTLSGSREKPSLATSANFIIQ